jgi:hypothetical protein
MATVQQNGSSVTPKSTKNNAGTIVNAGNTQTSMTKKALGRQATDVGSKVIDSVDTNKSVNAGTFAYNRQLPLSKRLTTSLGGVSNNVLLSGAAVPALVKSIKSVESRYTVKQATAIRAGHFNMSTGKYSTPPTVALDSFGNDNAARVGRSNPGSLVFRTGKRMPTSTNYRTKTG